MQRRLHALLLPRQGLHFKRSGGQRTGMVCVCMRMHNLPMYATMPS
jgi:hypothetical protein